MKRIFLHPGARRLTDARRLGLASFLAGCLAASAAALVHAPAPVDNPLKGLVPYQRQAGTNFPCSMEFNYLPLSALLKGTDQFDWNPLESLLNDVASRGRQAIGRVYLEYPGRTNVIPAFLLQAGVKVHIYTNTNTQPFPPKIVHTPDYQDPRLRAALTNFIAAFGARYDGDPRLGYITAGLLGTWGEWHTHPRRELWAGRDTQQEVLDAYERAFRKTPVLLRYPAGRGDRDYVSTAGRPFGYHDDSFAYATLHTGRRGDEWFFETKLRNAGLTDSWTTHPMGGEIRPEVWGCCFDDPPCTPAGQAFLDCVERVHVTWLMDSGVFRPGLDSARQARALEQVRRMGYELHVREVDLVPDEQHLEVRVQVENRGVAPFYQPWPVTLAAIGADGKRIREWVTSWDLRTVQPGPTGVAWRHRDETTGWPGGRYRILLGVRNPLANGRPVRFANETQDADLAGWLTLGACEIR